MTGGDDPVGAGDTPARRVRALADRIGAAETAAWCGDLLAGHVSYDDPDLPPLSSLGRGSSVAMAVRLEAAGADYWPRVWAARGLLHCWPAPVQPALTAALVGALSDPAWRVREMAAKVSARHEVGETADTLLPCVADPVPRVRAAAVRALGVVGETEHVDAVLGALTDDDLDVRKAAERAVGRLERRLDRTL